MKKTMFHWRHKNAGVLLSCMKLWRNNAGISERKEALAEMAKEMGDEGLVIGKTEEDYKAEKARLEEETAAANAIHAHVLAKHENFMAHIAFQNHENHYQGRLRYIFTQWAAFTKRQRHFADSIKNVIMKSMW